LRLESGVSNERVLVVARHHHERIDGKGYPDGLKGEQIPLYSRAVHACDAWHAMTSNRPYREALGQDPRRGGEGVDIDLQRPAAEVDPVSLADEAGRLDAARHTQRSGR
jgi:hypothetical protein